MVESSSVNQHGKNAVRVDWFDFEAFYQSKRFTDEQIHAKWRLALKDGPADMEGLNTDFAERAGV
eukprot:415751-Lingulodinium_polyedra.AAC.1